MDPLLFTRSVLVPLSPCGSSYEYPVGHQVSLGLVWVEGVPRVALGGEEGVSGLNGDGRTEEPWPDLRIKPKTCVPRRASLESTSSPSFRPERQALFTPNSQMRKLRPREVT